MTTLDLNSDLGEGFGRWVLRPPFSRLQPHPEAGPTTTCFATSRLQRWAVPRCPVEASGCDTQHP